MYNNLPQQYIVDGGPQMGPPHHFQPHFQQQQHFIDNNTGQVVMMAPGNYNVMGNPQFAQQYAAMQPAPHGVMFPPQRMHVPNQPIPLQILPNGSYANVPAGIPQQLQQLQQQSLSPAYIMPVGGMSSSSMNIPVAQPVQPAQINSILFLLRILRYQWYHQ